MGYLAVIFNTMKNIYTLIIILILSGCASLSDLPKQCIVTTGNGEFRYGMPFVNYVKGEGLIVRIAEKGNGCDGKQIKVIRDGVEVLIGY